ncbi:MAG: response regulator [Elusimicrobiaceae bacterium]|nr:response regulator [Elusimicrobiaceae bacterium]
MKKILIVEDNFVNRSFLSEIFTGKAHCVIAVNGIEAFAAYSQAIEKKEPFDLVLLDIEMPVMGGLETLAHIRDYEKLYGIAEELRVPVIVITAHEEEFAASFTGGCDNYMLKPVNPDQLLKQAQLLMAGPKPDLRHDGSRHGESA